MKSNYKTIKILILASLLLLASGCGMSGQQKPRLSLFIGVDISGSFIKSGYFDESLDFLSHYIYAHLHGIDKLEKPNVLFVSSIGGARPGEAKTFYPIQIFENKSVDEIDAKLHELFPKDKQNDFTDFNAFFEQVAQTIRNKNLVLRPVSVVMVSDGIPDIKKDGHTDFCSLKLHPLERLSRNITIRLLYTDPVTGNKWETVVPRRRVKIWTQDAKVMTSWNDSTIYIPGEPIGQEKRWIGWVKDNVDFGVRARRVD
jgi:hypothetical protein